MRGVPFFGIIRLQNNETHRFVKQRKKEMRVMDKSTMDKVLQYNLQYQLEHGISPSFRQIMHGLNLGSLATVQRYVKALEREGRINRTKIGNIALLPQLKKGESTIAPLVGNVACGEPSFAEENIEESFALPRALFGNGDLFLLHTFGGSMEDIGIKRGDLIVVRRQNHADDGQIVVALVEGNATLHKCKRTAPKSGLFYYKKRI